MFNRRGGQIVAITLGLAVIAAVVAFESLTRKLVAVDAACSYCHNDQEYRADVRLANSKPHPLVLPVSPSESVATKQQAACAECHLPPGFINSFYVYSHFSSLTDLYGHFRSRIAERAGNWLPPRQAAAYRVRDRLFETNSPTCRSCHVEERIEPQRQRGVNAHKKALDGRMSCIECHYNEKHQSVDLRENAFAKTSDN